MDNKELLNLFNIACTCVTGTVGNETQYGIKIEENKLYLIFQGSVQKEDWLYNFDFMVKPYKNMPTKWYVHKGFANCWKLARDEILEIVENTIENRQLIILGYSHGAGLALLAHEFFEYNGYSPVTYGFGCPRILWLPKKEILKRFRNVTLVRRKGDLVTHVPFSWLGFVHATKLLKIGSKAFIWWKRHLIKEYQCALIQYSSDTNKIIVEEDQ